MIRIDTIEDLIRVLDDRPEWREAVRVRLLPRELLELPAQLARFAAETDRRFEAIDKQFEAIDKQFEAIDKRFDEHDRRFEAIDKRFDEHDKRFDEHDKRFDEHDKRFDRLDAAIKSMRDDQGVLKGAHARNVAERDVGLIARSMDLRDRRVLTGAELFDLAKAGGADTGADDIRSYVHADLVIEAENEQGDTEYVAVEVSYTANGRDTARAVRNADFVTRFTGRPCRAAVASLRIDARIAELVESGRVAWYRLPRETLEAA